MTQEKRTCRSRSDGCKCILLVHHRVLHQCLDGHQWATRALIAQETADPGAAKERAAKRCAEIALAYADEHRDGRCMKDAHLSAWLNLAGKVIAERIRNKHVPLGRWRKIDARLAESR
jgi:hypothetical protein